MFDSKVFVGFLVMALENAGYEGMSIRSYSGRGMYGQSCVGISVDNLGEFMQTVATAAIIAAENDQEGNFVGALGRMSSDSLGRGSIYYWPNMKWSEELDKLIPEDSDY